MIKFALATVVRSRYAAFGCVPAFLIVVRCCLYYSVASDELENISEKIFTDDTDKKIEIAKEYLDSNFTYGKYTDILIQKSDNDVCFALASGFTKSGFEITYNWTEIAAAYEQAALEDMEWYQYNNRCI